MRHDIEVTCPYDKIPAFFEVDLTGLEIGRSIHISAIKLPDGVEPTIKGRDFTIATIAGAVKQDEDDTAAERSGGSGNSRGRRCGGARRRGEARREGRGSRCQGRSPGSQGRRPCRQGAAKGGDKKK